MLRLRSLTLYCMGLLASSAFFGSAHAELPALRPVQTLSTLPSDLTSRPGFDPDARFGHAVAVRGNIALVGMPYSHGLTGSVAAFTRGTDGVWKRTDTLVGSSGSTFFGQAIALRENIGAIASGSEVYIFKREHTGGRWKLVRRLFPPANALRSIDYQDGRVVVGGTGVAYVYQLDAAGAVLRRSRLAPNNGHPNDGFGFDVALAGDTIVVGAPDNWPYGGEPYGPGSAYVFKLSGQQWVQRQKLRAADGKDFDHFGFSVAIDRGMILVGAPGYQLRGSPYTPPVGEPVAQGAAFVYTPEAGVWRERTRLRPTPQEDSYYSAFGLHIAMFDQRVVVTAVRPLPTTSPDERYLGLAFAYERSGSNLRAFAVAGPESGLRLAGPGQPVSISGMTLLAGAPLSQCDLTCIGHAITYTLRLPTP